MNISDLNELKEHDSATMSLIGETKKTPTTVSYKNAVKVVENGLYGKILQDYVSLKIFRSCTWLNTLKLYLDF